MVTFFILLIISKSAIVGKVLFYIFFVKNQILTLICLYYILMITLQTLFLSIFFVLIFASFYEKMLNIRGTIMSIRISVLAKIPSLHQDWLISLNYEKG